MNFYLNAINLSLIFYVLFITYLIYIFILKVVRDKKWRKHCEQEAVKDVVYRQTQISNNDIINSKYLFGYELGQVFQSITNFMIGVTAILALVSTSLSNSVSFRPYVSVTNIGISTESEPSQFNLHITVVNTGNVPANNVKLYSQNILNNKMSFSKPSQPIFIPPTKDGLDYELNYNGDEVNKYSDNQNVWKIKVDITYDGVYKKNLFTTATFQYDPIKKSFVMIDGNAK